LKIEHDFLVLFKGRRERSFATTAERKKHLRAIARDLRACGYAKELRLRGLGGRHVNKLVRHWQQAGLSTGTMQNRLASLRWALAKVGRAHVMARTNAAYGVGKRSRSTTSKAAELDPESLDRIGGRYADRIRVSLQLQRYLGLRLEESLKIQPRIAVVFEDEMPVRVALRGSWCKNGRERTVEMVNARQREVVLDALSIAAQTHDSMIPRGLSYEQYRNKVYYRCRLAGIRPHALRHRFAQEMYRELTGQEAPVINGSIGEWLGSPGASEADHQARLQISAVLGHGRKNITNAYLGPSRQRPAS